MKLHILFLNYAFARCIKNNRCYYNHRYFLIPNGNRMYKLLFPY